MTFPAMKLGDYIERENLTAVEFGRRIGVSAITMWRYLRDGRIPEVSTMKRIIAETRGEVTPNDFFAAAIEEQKRRRR